MSVRVYMPAFAFVGVVGVAEYVCVCVRVVFVPVLCHVSMKWF